MTPWLKVIAGCVTAVAGSWSISKTAGWQRLPVIPIARLTMERLCAKGLASAQLAYHPDRLIYPLKRVGPKVSGKWERISWDEALDAIAKRILEYKEKDGPESVVFGMGQAERMRP